MNNQSNQDIFNMKNAAKDMITARQKKNLEENMALVNKGEKPIHYDIPDQYYYTNLDPKWYEEREELRVEFYDQRRERDE